MAQPPRREGRDVDAPSSRPDTPPKGLLTLLSGHGGDFHAIEARLSEIANFLPAARRRARGELRAALDALAALI